MVQQFRGKAEVFDQESKSRERIENKTPRIPCIIVTYDAAKRLTNQHALVSGQINGLEVRRRSCERKMSYGGVIIFLISFEEVWGYRNPLERNAKYMMFQAVSPFRMTL